MSYWSSPHHSYVMPFLHVNFRECYIIEKFACRRQLETSFSANIQPPRQESLTCSTCQKSNFNPTSFENWRVSQCLTWLRTEILKWEFRSLFVWIFVFGLQCHGWFVKEFYLIGLKRISAYKFTNPTILNTREIKLNEFQVPVSWEIVFNEYWY